jgi:hypothetical protein
VAKHITSQQADVSTSNASKNSTSSGTGSGSNNWVNWWHLHGKEKLVKVDVRELGKVVGVKFNCDTANKFNLLSRDGRREWRAAGGCEDFSGAVKGKEGVEGGI